MPDEYKNLDEGQVPSQGEATGDEVTLDKFKTMKPEEQVEFAKNIYEMRRAADRKYKEAAEERRRIEAEREYWEKRDRQRDEDLNRAYSQIAQWTQNIQQQGQHQQPSPRDYSEVPPEEAYRKLYEKSNEFEKRFRELDEKSKKEKEELQAEIHRTQSAIDYRDFLKEEIFPKYKDVKAREIDDWFTDHPNLMADRKSVHLAAQEIQKSKDDFIEAKVQEKLKEKARKAAEASAPVEGAPLASLPDGKDILNLSQEEQEELIRRDWKQLKGQ